MIFAWHVCYSQSTSVISQMSKHKIDNSIDAYEKLLWKNEIKIWWCKSSSNWNNRDKRYLNIVLHSLMTETLTVIIRFKRCCTKHLILQLHAICIIFHEKDVDCLTYNFYMKNVRNFYIPLKPSFTYRKMYPWVVFCAIRFTEKWIIFITTNGYVCHTYNSQSRMYVLWNSCV